MRPSLGGPKSQGAGTLALLAALASVACHETRPEKLKSFDQAAEAGDERGQGSLKGAHRCDNDLQGTSSLRFTLWMFQQQDGSVPVAFAHDAFKSSSSGDLVLRAGEKQAMLCFAQVATRTKHEGTGHDAVNAQTMICDQSYPGFSTPHCRGGPQWSRAEEPFDPKVAQESLYAAVWSTEVERAWGLLLAGDGQAALELFGRALYLEPQNELALRGFAQAQGDLQQARAAAERAVQLRPDDSASHEALVRACLAAHDDACTVGETPRMLAGAGAKDRSLLQGPLAESIHLAEERNRRVQNKLAMEAVPRDEPGGSDGLWELIPLDEVPIRPLELARAIGSDQSRLRHLNADVREPDGQAPAALPVVFLPDHAGGARDFHGQLAAFAKGRRVIALEPPGVGFSSDLRGSDDPRASLLADLGDAIDALHLTRFLLVGHGMGATLAAAYATAHREQVAGLLLIEPWGDLTQAKDEEVYASLLDMADDDYLSTLDFNAQWMLGRAGYRTRDLVLRELHMLKPGTARGYLQLAADEPVARELKALSIPIRLVHSENDDEPFSIARLLPELPELSLEDGISWPELEHAEQVNAELEKLIEESSSAAVPR